MKRLTLHKETLTQLSIGEQETLAAGTNELAKWAIIKLGEEIAGGIATYVYNSVKNNMVCPTGACQVQTQGPCYSQAYTCTKNKLC